MSGRPEESRGPGAWLEEELGAAEPVIGVLHLPPLPGCPSGEAWPVGALVERVRGDAAQLSEGGADAALVENFGDAPYRRDEVPPWTVALMTRLAWEAREASGLAVGVNVLRNAGPAAVAAAAGAGGRFVRVNVYAGARVTDQGVIQGRAHRVQDARRRAAPEVRVLADVRVKHSAPLGRERPLEREVEEIVGRGRADGVIVTGEATGRAPDAEALRRARRAAGSSPVFAGSGVTADSVARTLEHADGVIVGTWIKEGGRTRAPVSGERVRALVEAARRAG